MYQFFYYYSEIEDEDLRCDEEYIIYIFHGGNGPEDYYDVFRGIEFKGEMIIVATNTSGNLIDKLIVEFFISTGKSESKNIPIFLSPNGWYIAYAEKSTNLNAVDMNIYEIKIEDSKLWLNLVDKIERFDLQMNYQGGIDGFFDNY